jgi:hypothetical protein
LANKAGASLQCAAIRVTELDFDGSPAPGNLYYVSDQLIKIDFNPDMEAGIEVSNRGASGNLCVVYRTPDLMKRLTIELELCVPDPELEVIATGGEVLYRPPTPPNTQNVQGWAYPYLMRDPTPNGISVEAWTRYIVDGYQDPQQPYLRWVFPRMYLRKGNRTIDINSMVTIFDGFAVENPSWDGGPLGDWEFTSDRVVQAAFDNALPNVQIGTQIVPGPLATGATAGTPGEWTPTGAGPPDTFADLTSAAPPIDATPTTAWPQGNWVALGDGSFAHWDGTEWAVGTAP